MWYSGAQCRAHGAQVGGEAQTGGRFIQMRQRKASCWYFGEKSVFAVRTDVSELRLFPARQSQSAATLMISSAGANKILMQMRSNYGIILKT